MFSPISNFSIIIFLIFFASFIVYLFNRNREKKVHDTRKYLTPNDTNYNIASNLSDDVKNATPEEAREIIEKAKKSDQSSLTNEDFYVLKKKIRKQK